MLLFLEDMNKYPGIIDTETRNLSFLRMSLLLHKMGIKNNKFFLWLSQKELQGVDPYNLKDDSLELKQKIVYECKINYFYFLREVVRVPVQGDNPVMFNLDRANLAVSWLFCNSIDCFMVQPRQTGKTATAGVTNTWCFCIGYLNSTIGLFAKDSSLQTENVSQIKDMKKALPTWMIANSSKDLDNREGLSYVALNNEVKTFIAQSDKIAAAKQGRGEKLGRQHWDEFNFYNNNFLSYPSAVAASDAAAEQLRKVGLPACNILTSTAGRIMDPSGAYGYSVMNNCLRFTERYFDTENKTELVDILKHNSTNQTFYLEYSYKQLGKDDDWLAYRMRDKTQEQIEMDYLNKWQLGVGSSIVPANLLAKIEESIIDPVELSNHGPLIIKWYIERSKLLSEDNKYKNYIIGVDTSDNIGKDFTTFVVTDPMDLTVVAVCRCNISNFVHVVTCTADLMEQFPASILIPERNKNGAVLIDMLIPMLIKKGENPFTRIYNTFIQDYNESTPVFSSIDLGNGINRNKFGFKTTSSKNSREFLYSKVLITMLNYMASRVYDADLASEIKGLMIINGRVDHPEGCNDDTCISWLLTGFFVLFGKNHHMYGIPQGEVLRCVNAMGEQIDPVAKQQQLAIRSRIAELSKLLASCEHPTLKISYERELRYLNEQVDKSIPDNPILSADQIHHPVEEETAPKVRNYKQTTWFL